MAVPPGNGLAGIAASDPIQLQELSGYTEQVEKVVDNTKRFLQDLRITGYSMVIGAPVNLHRGLVHRFVDRDCA